MIKLYVLIPDRGSGDAFNKVLRNNGIDTEYEYRYIRPRVINNKITTKKFVVEDMNSIFKSFKDRTRSVVIACNTLQLWLPQIDEKYKRNIKVYTTFEACEWKFKNLPVKPLWLGTTPLVTVTKNFPTLLTHKRSDIQELVQEIIWREKMYLGDDIQTAFDWVKKDSDLSKDFQKIKINKIKLEILETLKSLGVKNAILGCTELPLLFKQKEMGINFIDPAQVLAEYVKSQSVSLVFAGGTISSSVTKDGLRVGGKVFDFLERLNTKMPGTYKTVNVTKEEIVYDGLSENMTPKEMNRLKNAILKILKTGVARIVITHGTDSMEHTARFLHKKLNKRLQKIDTKIVITGSNEHIKNPTTDAWENLIFAINGTIKSNNCSIFVAFHNKFIAATEVVKDLFVDGRMTYISKFSNEYKLGLKDFSSRNDNLIKKLERKFSNGFEQQSVYMYLVNCIRLDHSKFLNYLKNHKIKALVLKLYHSGTANTKDKKSSVSSLVAKFVKKGIVFFGATENGEPTNLHLYESSRELLKAGVVPLYNMSFPVAMAKLKLLGIKRNNLRPEEIIKLTLKNFAGEIDEKQVIKKDVNAILQKFK